MRRIVLFVAGCIFFLCPYSQTIDVVHYEYNIALTDQSDEIIARATIQVKFLQPATQFSLDLVSIGNGKGMEATGVFENGLPISYTHQNNKIFISTNAKKGEVKSYDIQYSGVPKDGLIISKNKYGDRTFFADNWPNRAHHWIPCIDRPDDKASFEFTVTAPPHYQVVSNGLKTEERNLGNGTKLTHWKEDTPLPTKVMVIGVAKFAVKEFPDSPPNIPVSAWIYPQDSSKGFRDYATATEIMKFFSNYIGPYPYKKLANVQSKTIFGGMENAGAIFYAENSVSGNPAAVEDLLAHEIAHQWFGDMASEKSFAHLWLSEGFATYFTNIYLEKKYGREALKKRMEDDRKQVVQFSRNSILPVVDTISPLMELLNANSYQKGGWVLHMLRSEVGDSAFHKIIRAYYQQFKGSNADSRDFEAVSEKVSGKELTWFFDQWLYWPGIPQLQIERNIDKDDVKIRITQKGRKFRFPLEVIFVRGDGSTLKETISVDDQFIEYKIKVPDVKSVVIDPDTKLLFSEVK